jgi:hypothetical protein
MELTRDSLFTDIAQSDTFVYLNTADYWDSYFTQMEVLQWRRFKKEPKFYPVEIDNSRRFSFEGQGQWETLTSNQKSLWAKISVGINRGMQGHHSIPLMCGKFGKNCYLLPCHLCGEHFLAAQDAVHAALASDHRLVCPHCHQNELRFEQLPYIGHFYRKPIILKRSTGRPGRPLRVLDAIEVLGLILNNDEPQRIPLAPYEGKKLRSDGEKMGIGLACACGAVVGGIILVGAVSALASWLSGDKSAQ